VRPIAAWRTAGVDEVTIDLREPSRGFRAGNILSPEEAHQPAIGRGDRGIGKVVSPQKLGDVIQRHVRAERTWTGPHDSLHRLLGPLPELLGPGGPRAEALVVHRHTRLPSRRRGAFTDRAYRLLQTTGGDIPARDVSRSRPRGVSAFRGGGGRPPPRT